MCVVTVNVSVTPPMLSAVDTAVLCDAEEVCRTVTLSVRTTVPEDAVYAPPLMLYSPELPLMEMVASLSMPRTCIELDTVSVDLP